MRRQAVSVHVTRRIPPYAYMEYIVIVITRGMEITSQLLLSSSPYNLYTAQFQFTGHLSDNVLHTPGNNTTPLGLTALGLAVMQGLM